MVVPRTLGRPTFAITPPTVSEAIQSYTTPRSQPLPDAPSPRYSAAATPAASPARPAA